MKQSERDELRQISDRRAELLDLARQECICALGEYYLIRDLHLTGCPAAARRAQQEAS